MRRVIRLYDIKNYDVINIEIQNIRVNNLQVMVLQKLQQISYCRQTYFIKKGKFTNDYLDISDYCTVSG